jgi:hypothetical protein
VARDTEKDGVHKSGGKKVKATPAAAPAPAPTPTPDPGDRIRNWIAVTDRPFSGGYNETDSHAIAWGGPAGQKKFVAVAGNGQIAYSANGISWSKVGDSKLGGTIYGIAWGGPAEREKFVAVGNGGIAYSEDGINWSKVGDSTFGNDNIHGVAWGGGKFVTGGTSGTMAYSTDGESWTAVSDKPFGNHPTESSINSIAWGGGRFVAVGEMGKIAYSADGIKWTKVSDAQNPFGTGLEDNISGVAWGGGKFVAVGGCGQMAYSANGESWTAVSEKPFGTDGYSGWISGITWGGPAKGEIFIAAGRPNRMAYSANGTNWTVIDGWWDGTGYPLMIINIAWGDGKFIAAGDGGRMGYCVMGN